MIWLAIVLLSWPLWGLFFHWLMWARDNTHDPLGYVLSLIPGPFVLWIHLYERRQRQQS